jgi:type IV pilus assembly protein PilN
MIHINLLPYREERRKAKRQRFYGMLGLVAILACLIVFAGWAFIEDRISAQQARNDFLKKENAALDKEIDEIKRLKDEAAALLSRKQIIEALQQDRAEAVRLLSELARQMPEGVYVRSMKQSGQKINLIGYAQSNARVSTLMRNIEGSQWLENPMLLEIKAVTVDKKRLNEFSMSATVKRESTQEAGKTAGQEAKKK